MSYKIFVEKESMELVSLHACCIRSYTQDIQSGCKLSASLIIKELSLKL